MATATVDTRENFEQERQRVRALIAEVRRGADGERAKGTPEGRAECKRLRRIATDWEKDVRRIVIDVEQTRFKRRAEGMRAEAAEAWATGTVEGKRRTRSLWQRATQMSRYVEWVPVWVKP